MATDQQLREAFEPIVQAALDARTLPPTEAEIRELVARRFLDNGSLNARGQLTDAFSDASSVLDDLYETDDLRQSELDGINRAEYEAMAPIRNRAIAELQEALVVAGLQFAAEHPEAPRAVPESVPA